MGEREKLAARLRAWPFHGGNPMSGPEARALMAEAADMILRAGASPPDWKQDQAETSRIKPKVTPQPDQRDGELKPCPIHELIKFVSSQRQKDIDPELRDTILNKIMALPRTLTPVIEGDMPIGGHETTVFDAEVKAVTTKGSIT